MYMYWIKLYGLRIAMDSLPVSVSFPAFIPDGFKVREMSTKSWLQVMVF